jgi:transcriptional regulator of acetoin/glycerol metabolism
MRLEKTSDKLLLNLSKSDKWTKTKLSKKLGISRPTLDNRIKTNTFTAGEVIVLKSLGLIS